MLQGLPQPLAIESYIKSHMSLGVAASHHHHPPPLPGNLDMPRRSASEPQATIGRKKNSAVKECIIKDPHTIEGTTGAAYGLHVPHITLSAGPSGIPMSCLFVKSGS